ncbi:MAG: hypothetical protein FWG03_01130 [Clostridiales bacterium]|nr:hypothetical protein [Clostridiales bacterium]
MKKIPLMMVLKGDVEYDDSEFTTDRAEFSKLFIKAKDMTDEEKKRWDETLYVDSLFGAAMYLIKAAINEIDASGMPLIKQVDMYMQMMEAITTRPIFKMLEQYEAMTIPTEAGLLN